MTLAATVAPLRSTEQDRAGPCDAGSPAPPLSQWLDPRAQVSAPREAQGHFRKGQHKKITPNNVASLDLFQILQGFQFRGSPNATARFDSDGWDDFSAERSLTLNSFLYDV